MQVLTCLLTGWGASAGGSDDQSSGQRHLYGTFFNTRCALEQLFDCEAAKLFRRLRYGRQGGRQEAGKLQVVDPYEANFVQPDIGVLKGGQDRDCDRVAYGENGGCRTAPSMH